MTIMKRILILIIVAAAAMGCKKYDVDEILLEREDISLTIKGRLIYSFNPVTDQVGYNANDNIFRMYSDDLGNWVTLKCRTSVPENGHKVKADLMYTASTTTKTHNGITFSVTKRSQDGRIWLWSDDEKIGLIVRELK